MNDEKFEISLEVRYKESKISTDIDRHSRGQSYLSMQRRFSPLLVFIVSG